MKIAVNTRLLLKGKLEGIGWFTYENLKRITRAHPEHHFFFLFDREYDEEFIFSDNITPIILAPQARHPFLYYIWFQFSVRSMIRKLKVDLFLSPDGYLPLKSGIKTVNVFHDLNFEHYPKDVPFLERWYYHKFFPKFAEEAHAIATVSEYSKKDIMNLYGVPSEKIGVVYNGANEIYTPLSAEQKAELLRGYSGGRQYFYFIGSLHPRKNLVNLFKAYELYRRHCSKENLEPAMLVITGARKWWTNEIESTFNSMEYKSEVVFTGRLPLSEIHKLMASALALTYVSYFEGFGIPIVEAFRCGTPVITSNVTSMPEIAGGAALIIDPFEPESITEAMVRIMTDEPLRAKLIKDGLERAKIFTWDKSAERLWNIMNSML